MNTEEAKRLLARWIELQKLNKNDRTEETYQEQLTIGNTLHDLGYAIEWDGATDQYNLIPEIGIE